MSFATEEFVVLNKKLRQRSLWCKIGISTATGGIVVLDKNEYCNKEVCCLDSNESDKTVVLDGKGCCDNYLVLYWNEYSDRGVWSF